MYKLTPDLFKECLSVISFEIQYYFIIKIEINLEPTRHFLRYILTVPFIKYVFIVLSIQIDFRRPII